MQDNNIKEQRDSSVQGSLDRLLLCNQIRELADYPKPVTVKKLSWAHKLLVRIAKLAYSSYEPTRLSIGLLRRTLIYPPVIILLRLLLYGWGFRHTLVDTVSLICRRILYLQLLSSEITGYVTSTDRETPLIRVCLLLRAMRRYGVCIEFLIQRLNSGLPTTQTQQWLSFFLREIDDMEAAGIFSPPTDRREATDTARNLNAREQLSSVSSNSPRLKYGVVMLTMFDSDVFRSSLLSLLDSDFRGQIVVVEEGNQPERVCESFCNQLLVKYIKNPEWSGVDGTTNLGIKQLAPETDIVIYTHNDVLWSPCWFGQLDSAWERVYDSNKVGIINLGYLQFQSRHSDATLYELFVRGKYEDLIWVLRAMGDAQPIPAQDVQIKDMSRLFGLARDDCNDAMAKLRMMNGRFSVGASFPLQIWKSLGGFDPDISTGLPMELQYHCFQNRKWNLWINNTPLIHMRSSDYRSLTAEELETFLQKLDETYEAFPKKYEWEIDHFLSTYFAETSIIYHDEIVNAANELRFSDIDFVFDDVFDRLERKRLSSCEIVWCRSRATCKYR